MGQPIYQKSVKKLSNGVNAKGSPRRVAKRLLRENRQGKCYNSKYEKYFKHYQRFKLQLFAF